MAQVTAVQDIREALPVVVKSGTTHKPVWTLGDKRVRFVKPLSKKGTAPDGTKPRLGKQIMAKYKAGVTVKGEDLMFVGVFSTALVA